MAGTLFVVATPIGNLDDLTFRALRTLKEVDLVAAEDTRRTAKLLAHYEIRKPVVSLREHNEFRESPRIVARIAAGESVALVSDAGTPGISDPGARLVRTAREAGLSVVPIPGPSAVTAAISASGFDASHFFFMGFPPSHGQARKEWFMEMGEDPRTIVFFEAPHRISSTMTEIGRYLAKRQIAVFREISKIHEQSGYITNLFEWPERGEFVIVLGPESHPSPSEISGDVAQECADIFSYLTKTVHISRDLAYKAVASATNLPIRTVKRSLKRMSFSGE